MSIAIQTAQKTEKQKPPIMSFSYGYWGWTGRTEELKFLPSQQKQLRDFLTSSTDAFFSSKSLNQAIESNAPKKPLLKLSIFGPACTLDVKSFKAIFKPILRFLHKKQDLLKWIDIETPHNPNLSDNILETAKKALLPQAQRHTIAHEVEHIEARKVLAKAHKEKLPLQNRAKQLESEIKIAQFDLEKAERIAKKPRGLTEQEARKEVTVAKSQLNLKKSNYRRALEKLDAAKKDISEAKRELDALNKQ